MATASPAALDDFIRRFTTQIDTGFGVISGEVLRWRRKFGQLAKVGSTSMKDGLYDWEAEAVHG